MPDTPTNESLAHFWHLKPEEILHHLEANPEGRSQKEATERIQKYGKNVIEDKKKFGILRLFLSQFNTPIIYLLMFAAILALILKRLCSSQ